MKHIALKLSLIVALMKNPNLRHSNMSVPGTHEETQIWEFQMHVCQTISTTAGDPQFLDTEISHYLTLFSVKLSLIEDWNYLIYMLKINISKNSKCMSLLEGHRRPLCHYIVKLIKVLKIFRMYILIYKLSITCYITFVNFVAIR